MCVCVCVCVCGYYLSRAMLSAATSKWNDRVVIRMHVHLADHMWTHVQKINANAVLRPLQLNILFVGPD